MKEIPKTEAEWAKKLSKGQFDILRNKGTEMAFTGKYWNCKENGDYLCSGCGAKLFPSGAKFESGTGWPSFSSPANLNSVELKKDLSRGMRRTEVICKKCKGHLGHLFYDGSADSGGKRFCINSCALEFMKHSKNERKKEK